MESMEETRGGEAGVAAPEPRRAPRPHRPRAWLALLAVVTVTLGGLAAGRIATPAPVCPAPASHPEWSVARRWDEALLDAIRRALPNPPLHARNLYHLSVAIWDAWATYDQRATGVVVTDKEQAANVPGARDEAISYAAYRLLSARFIKSVGADASLSEFDDVMDSLCHPLDIRTTDGHSPAAVGNRIAKAVLADGLQDGSNEAGGYASDYKPVNPPLVVASTAAPTAVDPNRWQPLQIEHMVSQNGIPVTNGVQQAIGPQWGHVTSFGLPEGGSSGTPIDPGPPPRLGDPSTDAAFKAQVVEVIRDSSLLDADATTTMDVSPAARGGNDLGSNDGHGHAVNPATGQPYAARLVKANDFYRAIAQFWADGPKSETPPGHWNGIANVVGDELGSNLRIGGTGRVVDRLEWDTKLYLALNGAVHDAAIAAWGLKGRYDGTRPISMIRYMGGLGQSSDPSLPSFNRAGLPLVAGLIQVIRKADTGAGGDMARLAGHEGQIAVKAWLGNPADPKTQHAGVGWILATGWAPFQLPTFVTPSFQGYISGHSTFSRAAAEVMTAFTGSEYFPGGESSWTVKANSMSIELGPSADVVLEWATYNDAADQAGQSRLYGGIHVQADDFTGRIVGSTCGKDAWALAQRHYAGGPTP
jgi:hypothetical protein